MGASRLDDYIDAWLLHTTAGAASEGPELRRLLSLMSPDVRYEDVPSGAVFNGHDGVRDMCKAAYSWSNDVTIKVTSRQTDGRYFAFEVLSAGTNTAAMAPGALTGRSFSFPMASVGSFTGDGVVDEHRDYWDMHSFLRQIGLTKD